MNRSLIRNLSIEELLHYHLLGEIEAEHMIDLIEGYIVYLEDFLPSPDQTVQQEEHQELLFEYDSGKDIGYKEGYDQGYYDGFMGHDQPDDLMFIELPEIIRRNL